MLGSTVDDERFGFFTVGFIFISFVPFTAIRVRRLHDTGRSGLWLLISFIPLLGALVLFIFMLLDSDPGPNQWGPNPKDENDFYEADEKDITSIGEDL